MNKEVLISVRGLQFEGAEDAENIEVIQKGMYYKKNGMHYLLYDEPVEGTDKVNKNIIKFSENEVYLTKRGAVNTAMAFQEEKKNMTNYQTPYGGIMVGIDTHNITVKETEDQLNLAINYSLDVNYEFLAKCNIVIEAKNI